MKTLTVFDTFGFFFRNYYALPKLKSRSGFPTGLLTGFLNFILTLSKNHETDYLVFALDSKESGFRKEIYPEYKANRSEVPEDLLQQLPVAIEWIEKMSFHNLSIARYEADDVIASLVRCAKAQGIRVRIASHDKDLYQLIDDGKVVIYDPAKKIEIDSAKCFEKYGVRPDQFIDYQSLVGDSSDNVPGVKGVGDKTAQKLLAEFQTLDALYENLDQVKPERVRKMLEEHQELALTSRELVRLRDDAFPECQIHEFVVPEKNPLLPLAEELRQYDMSRILDQMKKSGLLDDQPQKVEQASSDTQMILLDREEKVWEVIQKIPDDAAVAIDTETTSLDTKTAQMVGFSFCWESTRAYYVPVAHNYLGVGDQISVEAARSMLVELSKKKIIGHNLKFDLALIERICEISDVPIYADTMVLAWLVESGETVGLDSLMKRYFGHEMISFSQTVKKGEDFSSVHIEDAVKYAAEDAEDAWATLVLYERLLKQLDLQSANHLLDEFQTVEAPFVHTLKKMERLGIKVDLAFLKEAQEKSQQKLEGLTGKIHQLAGEEFNINSTQQLGKILFEKLGLKATKKTKTGYSTNEKVLEGLQGEHEIIPQILEYREAFKLHSTYIEPLQKYAQADSSHRIYTSFLHTGTATGRLSSKNPNLQNIPVRTELGREIRRAFVAEEGFSLVSVDYSQIELRLLAHFSGDSVLKQAFFDEKDIHMEAAIKIFGEEHAAANRHIAKSINFGLIYGMGARRLSETLKIPNTEAKSYIESYFASFPTVKSYLASVEELVKKQGYVETLLLRRRYFDFENAQPFQQAGFVREASNTIFQGSAADLIKMSMNEIYHSLLDDSEARMLLQVHDELIFEIKSDKLDVYVPKIQETMETIHPLEVPLQCGVTVGQNWGELK